ncbi:MAG: hypothetical protein QXI16_00155 [Sulfolobaceae archaeon]
MRNRIPYAEKRQFNEEMRKLKHIQNEIWLLGHLILELSSENQEYEDTEGYI